MKIIPFIFGLLVAAMPAGAQTCASCGATGTAGSFGTDVGPSFSASLGSTQYGVSAGHLFFNANLPDPSLSTPAALQFPTP